MAQEATATRDVDNTSTWLQNWKEDLACCLIVPVVCLEGDRGLLPEGLRRGILEGNPSIVDQNIDTTIFLLPSCNLVVPLQMIYPQRRVDDNWDSSPVKIVDSI